MYNLPYNMITFMILFYALAYTIAIETACIIIEKNVTFYWNA